MTTLRGPEEPEAPAQRRQRSEDGEAESSPDAARDALAGTAALAQQIVNVLEADLGYENGAVLLHDRATSRLVPIALSDRGEGEEFVRKDMAFVAARAPQPGTGITGWVAKTGERVVTGDVSSDSRYFCLRDSIRSEIAVPLRSSRGILGVLNAETARPEAYTERDARVLALFASQISLSIENAWLEEQLRRLERLEGVALRAGGAAHDMNNLLTVIACRCEILLRPGLDDPLKSDLRSIRDTALKTARLTRDLMAFRRSEDPKPRRTDLNQVVRGLERTIAELVGAGVQITTNLAPDLGPIYADPSRLEQVITNLALNAGQAMPHGGTLTIETSNADGPPGPQVTLSVRDTGAGMDEATRARIFEPFFTTRPRGTGLGLPTIRRIVEQHGGRIGFESEPGQGTTFRIHLPRC